MKGKTSRSKLRGTIWDGTSKPVPGQIRASDGKRCSIGGTRNDSARWVTEEAYARDLATRDKCDALARAAAIRLFNQSRGPGSRWMTELNKQQRREEVAKQRVLEAEADIAVAKNISVEELSERDRLHARFDALHEQEDAKRAAQADNARGPTPLAGFVYAGHYEFLCADGIWRTGWQEPTKFGRHRRQNCREEQHVGTCTNIRWVEHWRIYDPDHVAKEAAVRELARFRFGQPLKYEGLDKDSAETFICTPEQSKQLLMDVDEMPLEALRALLS